MLIFSTLQGAFFGYVLNYYKLEICKKNAFNVMR